jgi:hypothetical protein
MYKAYDRVEWNFLESMLRKLGFHEEFVALLMACVCSVKYKIRFNSQEAKGFISSRGLRHGDPLSPYLFLICAERLSSLLAHREEVRGMEGVRVCRIGADRSESFLYLLERIIKRLEVWKEKLLSMALVGTGPIVLARKGL